MPEPCKTPSTRKPRVLVAISMRSGFSPAVTNGIFRFLGNGGGWSSPNYPKNLLRQRFGISMRQWRLAHA